MAKGKGQQLGSDEKPVMFKSPIYKNNKDFTVFYETTFLDQYIVD